MRNLVLVVVCVASLVWSFPGVESRPVENAVYVDVAAGSLERKDSVVSFALPRTLKAKSYALRDDAGHMLPLQIDPNGTATFVLPDLKAGTSKRYSLVALQPNADAIASGVQVISDHDPLTISATTVMGLARVGVTSEGRSTASSRASRSSITRSTFERRKRCESIPISRFSVTHHRSSEIGRSRPASLTYRDIVSLFTTGRRTDPSSIECGMTMRVRFESR